MNTNQALEYVRLKLSRLGFRETTPGKWKLPIADGQLTATMLATSNPIYRCEWTDGRRREVAFFEFGVTERMDADGVEGLARWAVWYADGNRLTNRGATGYTQTGLLAA